MLYRDVSNTVKTVNKENGQERESVSKRAVTVKQLRQMKANNENRQERESESKRTVSMQQSKHVEANSFPCLNIVRERCNLLSRLKLLFFRKFLGLKMAVRKELSLLHKPDTMKNGEETRLEVQPDSWGWTYGTNQHQREKDKMIKFYKNPGSEADSTANYTPLTTFRLYPEAFVPSHANGGVECTVKMSDRFKKKIKKINIFKESI